MEDHHIAAHRVADALRVIAENLPKLSAQASDPVYDLLEGAFRVERQHSTLDFVDLLNSCAAKVEETAPFTPLTDDEYMQEEDEC